MSHGHHGGFKKSRRNERRFLKWKHNHPGFNTRKEWAKYKKEKRAEKRSV